MNFDKINPISLIDGNCVLTRLGDISFCFEITLPEIKTLSVDQFNDIHGALNQLFIVLPENTLVHRQDIFTNQDFDPLDLFPNKDDFFEDSLIRNFKGRNYLSQKSYLYITLLNGFGFKRNISALKYFKKHADKDQFNTKINDFKDKVDKAIVTLDEVFKIRALKEDDILELVDKHLNGYEPNKISSPIFKPEFKIGNKYFSIIGLDNDMNQKDGTIEFATVNREMSSDISTMYESYMSRVSYDYLHEHSVNTFIFYDDQYQVKKELESEQSKLNALKLFGNQNAVNAQRLQEFLTDVENENVNIVRTHFNVTIWDHNHERFLKKDKELQGAFSKLGVKPTEYIYNDYPFLFISNFPGCGGHLPKEYTFLSFTDLSLCYTINEGTSVINSNKGYYYCNRNNNIPYKIDTFFEPYESKLIDNRNYIVIAPSGGGKSFFSRDRLLQQYHMGFDQVVINIGGDDKLVRLINSYGKDEALYVKYKQGETLPINPFYVENSIDNDKIEFLINFIWLLWGGKDDIANNPDVSSILNKILSNYYEIDIKSMDENGSFNIKSNLKEFSIQTFYQYLDQNQELIIGFFKGDTDLFNLNSLLINLEKFAVGSYSTLFSRTKPTIGEKKKFIEFELDNIKDHPFLFPIFSMLISDITFNTMWTTGGFKDFYIDEAWKILEKPGMAVLLKYLYKTIRKFDGSVGIAFQQITDLSGDLIVEKAILGNCSVKYILNHKNVLDDVPILKKKLSLSDSDVSMLLSIKNRTSKSDKIKYTELLLLMGSDFSRIVRKETSAELSVIFDSEKTRLKKFDNIYYGEANKSMEESIKLYLN